MGKANHAYHRFFEGYTEYREINEKGKPVIRRVYTGLYYTPEQSRAQQIIYRIFYFLLLLLFSALFLTATTANLASNLVWYPTVPIVAAVLVSLWLLCAFCRYLPIKARTAYEYRSSSQSLQNASLGLAGCMGCAALLHGLFLLLHHESASQGELFCIGCLLGAMAVMLILHFMERRLRYTTYPSTAQVPEESVDKNAVC